MADTIALVADSTTATLTTVATLVGEKVTKEMVFGAQNILTNIDFLLLLLVALLVAFFTTQSWTIRDIYYKSYFTTALPSLAVEVIAFVCDILMATGFVLYIWNQQNPLVGADSDWYDSIYGLWVATQGLKWMWSVLFWRLGWSYMWLGFSFIMSIATTLTTLALAILYFIRSNPISGGLTIVVTVVYIFAVIFSGYVWRRAARGNTASRSRDNNMLKKRPQYQQR